MADIISQAFKPKPFRIITRETNLPVLQTANVVAVSIKYGSTPLSHKMESGKTKIDCRIIKPTRLSVDVIASNPDQLEEINAVILDREGLYMITTKGLQFDNMKVAPAFMAQTQKNISSTPIRIEFVQILLENRDPVIFEFAADSTLIERGIAIATQAEQGVRGVFDKVTSAESRGADVATDLFSRVFNR